MMTIKKMFRPQVLFPSVILILLVVALTLAALFPPKPTFRLVKADEPGVASIFWADVTEAAFFEQMTLSVYAEVNTEPQYYKFFSPIHETPEGIPVTIYEANVKAVLAQPRNLKPFDGSKVRMGGQNTSFIESGIKTGRAYVLMLVDARDNPNFVPDETVSSSYYDDFINTVGYSLITPSLTAFPVEQDLDTPYIKNLYLPEYLRSDGEYTTLEELQESIAAGRAKYGMSEYAE